ncbi:MAG TPA: hypothetical protein VN620_18735, partial [Candidatus Methylomirabilis sp.]|nr:hypothetical protein [Candidatus Methylomirabilis sp.]
MWQVTNLQANIFFNFDPLSYQTCGTTVNEYQRGHDDAGPEVVLVNATYPPEPVVSAQIGHDLAQYLA